MTLTDTFPNELLSDQHGPAVFDSMCVSGSMLLAVTSDVLENV